MTQFVQNAGGLRWSTTPNLDPHEGTKKGAEKKPGTERGTLSPSPGNARLARAFAILFAQQQSHTQPAPRARQHDAAPFQQLHLVLREQQQSRRKQVDHAQYLLKQYDGDPHALLQHIIDQSNNSTNLLQHNVGDSNNPFQDIIDKLNNAMNQEDGNLQQYETIVAAIMKALQFISSFMATIGQYVKSGDDGKTIDMDSGSLRDHFWHDFPSMGTIIKLTGNIDDWKKELGPLIPSLLKISDDGSVSLNWGKYDTTYDQPYNDIDPQGGLLGQLYLSLSQMCRGDSQHHLNPAAYQAWWAGFQGLESQVENQGQTIAEKYSHRNSNFDNLIKIISSTVQSMVDTSKQFLQI